MQDLINEFLVNAELQNSLQRYFLQSFAALVVLPLSFNMQGFLQRFGLAIVAAVFWQYSLGTLHVEQYFIIDVLSGFLVSLSLFLPVLIVVLAAELLEQSRGMNLSSFFTGVGIGGNSYIGQGVKLYVFVLLLQAGFLEQLFVNLSKSLQVTSTDIDTSLLVLSERLGEIVYQALSTGCCLLYTSPSPRDS